MAVGGLIWGPRALVTDWRRLAACFLVGNAADLDFIPGILVGQPNAYHHGISHSLGAAALAAALVALVARGASRRRWVLLAALGYSSHVLLDFFSLDTSVPRGVPALWPLSAEYWISPYPLFEDIQRERAMERFVPSLFSVHNLQAVARELGIMGLVTAICTVARARWSGDGERGAARRDRRGKGAPCG
jgi:inner membrane protein